MLPLEGSIPMWLKAFTVEREIVRNPSESKSHIG